MKDINDKEIVHPAYLKLNQKDVAFTVKTKTGLSFFSESTNKIVELNEDSIKEYKVEALNRINIKANEELFHEYHAISKSLASLAGIVQNDMDADLDLLKEWETIFDECVTALKELKIKTKNYITK